MFNRASKCHTISEFDAFEEFFINNKFNLHNLQVCFVENRLKKLKTTYLVEILIVSLLPTMLSQLAMVSLVKLLSFGALQ